MIDYNINYNSNSKLDAINYMTVRNHQLLKFGYISHGLIEINEGIVCFYTNGKKEYGAIYLYEDYRGMGNYKRLVKEYDIYRVVTLEECKMSEFLKHINIDFVEEKHSSAYKLIEQVYGYDRANRSNVPYMCHIDEGGYILNELGVSDKVKDAYYLHPITQGNIEIDLSNIDPEVVKMAKDYAITANSYLSNMSIDNFKGFSSKEVKMMLIADKVQNRKDFIEYHFGIHKNSDRLYEYFNEWGKLLEIDYQDWSYINAYTKHNS